MSNIIIVDVRPVLDEYSQYKDFYHIYQRYPLNEIIQSLLTINQYEDNQLPWLEMESRFDDVWDTLNFENIDFFYHNLVLAIDEFIKSKLPVNTDTAIYIFDKWADYSSLVLRKDPNYMFS